MLGPGVVIAGGYRVEVTDAIVETDRAELCAQVRRRCSARPRTAVEATERAGRAASTARTAKTATRDGKVSS